MFVDHHKVGSISTFSILRQAKQHHHDIFFTVIIFQLINNLYETELSPNCSKKAIESTKK